MTPVCHFFFPLQYFSKYIVFVILQFCFFIFSIYYQIHNTMGISKTI